MMRGRRGSRGITNRGSSAGVERSAWMRLGIDLFLERGAYTTVASAVAMLVTLTLVFSSATAVWSMSRAGDVQTVADSAALAGANVVSSYCTAATVVDAAVASLGFAGMAAAATGLVGTLVPGARTAAGKALDVGMRMIDARNELAASASRGLSELEEALPYLVGANASLLCRERDGESVAYTGVALAVPNESASSFPALEGDEIDTSELDEASDRLDETAEELERAAERTASARERAWKADCGQGPSMRERAASLSGLSDAENPGYASSITWPLNAGLKRAQAYYRWRSQHDEPEGSGVEAKADSASRRAFYSYAYRQLRDARVEDGGTGVVVDVPLLPRNEEEVRRTELYTERIWPATHEDIGTVLHFGPDCPGAIGPSAGSLALSSVGADAAECPVCHFTVSDVGKTPAASTSIANGFEHHLRAYTEALRDYAACRNEELEMEGRAKGEAGSAADAFQDALGRLAARRPKIAPPGRYGCVSLVIGGETSSPAGLDTDLSGSVDLDRRGAVSAAALAPDPATREFNVLSSFFSRLQGRVGSEGLAGLAGGVMELWGDLLVAYGDMGEALSAKVDELTGRLGALGAGPIARWLRDRLGDIVGALGLEPVDLTLLKPVLVDSSNVIARSDFSGLADIKARLRELPVGSTDPGALLEAVGYEVGRRLDEAEFTIAELPLPFGGSIPLTIRLRDVASAREGGG